jgi:hypothetical protein
MNSDQRDSAANNEQKPADAFDFFMDAVRKILPTGEFTKPGATPLVTRDSQGRVSQALYASGRARGFEYDEHGHVCLVKEDDGTNWRRETATIWLQFDAGGKMLGRAKRGVALVSVSGDYSFDDHDAGTTSTESVGGTLGGRIAATDLQHPSNASAGDATVHRLQLPQKATSASTASIRISPADSNITTAPRFLKPRRAPLPQEQTGEVDPNLTKAPGSLFKRRKSPAASPQPSTQESRVNDSGSFGQHDATLNRFAKRKAE